MENIMKLRKILFERDEPTGARSMLDIFETELPSKEDEKARAAIRRRILRELDKQITDLLDGRIDEISLVAMAD